ncbi:FCD domain-containing protein [Nonomuraea sp. NPDC049750]|uniref:FCD domain-containing protein n=1 Tax=Nonomuraea sp. NPDC049750 TaxID=3154738 RepID=UPI00340F0678
MGSSNHSGSYGASAFPSWIAWRGSKIRACASKAYSHLGGLIERISAAAWGGVPTWEREAEEHRQILQAAQSGSATEAAALLHDHMRCFVDRVKDSGGLEG